MLYDFFKTIVGGLIFILIAYSINSFFTDNPWLWVIIEFLVLFLINGVIQALNYREIENRNLLCVHNENREECQDCKREEKERLKKNEITNRYNELRSSEANRLSALRNIRSKYLLELSPNGFEDSVAYLFKKMGYRVEQTPYVNDGGKDAIAYKDNKKYLIECKRYAVGKAIGRPMLQKFHSAIVEEKAVRGFFITTSHFASTAFEYARNYNIELIDGDALASLYEEYFPSQDTDNVYRQICLECGDEVRFTTGEQPETNKCLYGHAVIRALPNITTKPTIVRKKKLSLPQILKKCDYPAAPSQLPATPAGNTMR